MAATYDWSKFTLRINIQASVKAVYDAWTNKELIELWFLKTADMFDTDGKAKGLYDTFQKGDTYKWYWYGYEDAESGTILEANGENEFAFTFNKAGDCYIRVYEEQGDTIMELSQVHIPTDERSMHEYHLGCKMGWTFFLTNLKSVLEGGPDLRNRNEALKKVLNN